MMIDPKVREGGCGGMVSLFLVGVILVTWWALAA